MNCSEESNGSTPEPEASPSFGRISRQTDYFFIKEIIRHRCDPTCETLFEIKVRCEGDEDTWEPESNLQKDAARALFAYWNRVKGGRESAMVERELWHVFEVVSHRTKPDDTVYLQVAWIGSPDTSWEPEANIQKVASKLVENYWRSVGGRSGAMKRPAEAKSFVEDATGGMNKRSKRVQLQQCLGK
ncbi:chromo domain-containing protein [Colletotrichum tofieldiae]|nr:chromo domain-containing protein [Colletotrichum tofieldiae]